MTTATDPCRCPLCGDDNACGMEAGKGSCWCMALKIPPEVLERIPSEARELACVCERCATGTKRALRVPVSAADRSRARSETSRE